MAFPKTKAGKPRLEYEKAVEEALCFGWIDSLTRRIDDTKYCRKFTPRKDASRWSRLDRERAEQLISAGKMTEFGRAKIEAAKRSGTWRLVQGPATHLGGPQDLSDALTRNEKARSFFEKLAPTDRTACELT